MSSKDNISKQISSGLFWRFAERILAQGVSFAVSIVLARMLMPEDYGAVAMVMVFINIANIFATSGLNKSLIQKASYDEVDFSSVFYVYLLMMTLVYILLFGSAGYIAEFYHTPILVPVIRVLSLKLILSAYSSIQYAYVSIKMVFRKFFWSTFYGTVISGVVGIILAYNGFGVWALVVQYLTNSAIDALVLTITVRWRPKTVFSMDSIKALFPYGWRCLLTDLIGAVYSNLRSLMIGKNYNSESLGYYNKGKSLPDFIMVNMINSVNSVIFPAFSKYSDDRDAMKDLLRKSMRMTAYIVFPMMFGMIAVARLVVLILLTEKWLDCVIFVQLVCVYHIFHSFTQISLQSINAVGRSDITLRLEFIKKPVSIAMILLSMPFGVKMMAATLPISSVFTMLVNLSPNKKLLNYGLPDQIRDIFSNMWMSVLMAAVVYLITVFSPLPHIITLVIAVLAGVIVYIAVSVMTHNDSFYQLFNMVKKYIKL